MVFVPSFSRALREQNRDSHSLNRRYLAIIETLAELDAKSVIEPSGSELISAIYEKHSDKGYWHFWQDEDKVESRDLRSDFEQLGLTGYLLITRDPAAPAYHSLNYNDEEGNLPSFYIIPTGRTWNVYDKIHGAGASDRLQPNRSISETMRSFFPRNI